MTSCNTSSVFFATGSTPVVPTLVDSLDIKHEDLLFLTADNVISDQEQWRICPFATHSQEEADLAATYLIQRYTALFSGLEYDPTIKIMAGEGSKLACEYLNNHDTRYQGVSFRSGKVIPNYGSTPDAYYTMCVGFNPDTYQGYFIDIIHRNTDPAGAPFAPSLMWTCDSNPGTASMAIKSPVCYLVDNYKDIAYQENTGFLLVPAWLRLNKTQKL